MWALFDEKLSWNVQPQLQCWRIQAQYQICRYADMLRLVTSDDAN